MKFWLLLCPASLALLLGVPSLAHWSLEACCFMARCIRLDHMFPQTPKAKPGTMFQFMNYKKEKLDKL